MKLNLLEPGDVVVAIQGWRGGLGNSNTLRVFPWTDTVLTDRSCQFLSKRTSFFFFAVENYIISVSL